jgi:cytosine/adenosine deaminase-related metal-dependent hydrolase
VKLFRARYLLPIATGPCEDGALLVEGGRITAVGRFSELRRAAAVVVDFGDAILLPPLVNAHTHLELTHFPQWEAKEANAGDPTSFTDWLLRIIRVKRGVTPDLYLPSLQEGIRQSLAAGTGAVGDILSCFPARHGYLQAPLRGRLYLETLGRDPALNSQVLARIVNILEEKRCGHLELGISPHSPYTLSQA